MPPVILDPSRFWSCPSCGMDHVTTEARAHVPMHPCRALKGCTVPFVEVGSQRARHVVNERDDYVGADVPYLVDGRPVMSVSTVRDDGSNDLVVFAPTAVAHGAAN